MRLLLLFAVAALSAASADAAVYKCTGANGAVEFRDKPCPPGNGGEITVKGVARSDESSAAPEKGGDSAILTGVWCEYAVSMDPGGEKDESTPAQWTITGDTLEYRPAGGVGPGTPSRAGCCASGRP